MKMWLSENVDLRLIVGPDDHHPAHMVVDGVEELLALLAIDFKDLYAGRGRETPLFARVHDAVGDWNQTWAEEAGPAYPTTWRWLGIMVLGQVGPVVWELTLGDRTAFNLRVDDAALDSRALAACRQVAEVVAGVLGGEGDEDHQTP